MFVPLDPFRYFLAGLAIVLVVIGAGAGTIILEGARGWREDIAKIELLERENMAMRARIDDLYIRIDKLPPLSQPLKVPLLKKPKCLKRENGRCKKWKK